LLFDRALWYKARAV